MRRFCLVGLLLIGRAAAGQQVTATVVDAGPGPVGRYLDQLLRRPDTRVVIGDTIRVTKDSTYPAAVVFLAKRVDVSGTMRGDVVVIGGDLFLKPGGQILGEGIAIGGGAYNSLLGNARAGMTSYRDFTYDAVRDGNSIALRYRETYVKSESSRFTLPSLIGFHLPTYDRSNGLSLAVGPSLTLGRSTLDVTATYRSQLGRVDPAVTARYDVNRKLWIEGFAGRETRSNDHWINGRISNSLNALISGRDERNWYRASGAWATWNRLFETTTMTATYSLGASAEAARAVRPGPAPTSGPWSLTGKSSVEGMFRPNPQVPSGNITSVIGGAAYRWTAGDVKARLDVALDVPVSVSTGQRYVQTTVDGQIGFPTFGLQRYRLEAHGVITAADTAPMQRYAYLGGSGTLSTDDVLAFGGDELLFLESRYEIPIPRIKLPLVGSPTLTFRHILGSVGVQTLPDITQIVGLRLSVPFLRVQVLMDTDSREVKLSGGLSLSR